MFQACNSAIKLDEHYIKAYIRRIVCYQELDQYEEAVRDADKLHNMEHSRESKQRLRDANNRLKMSKRKDYYKILGCSRSVTEDGIKKAYKKAALKHHPDRHSHGTEEERSNAEKQFKEVFANCVPFKCSYTVCKIKTVLTRNNIIKHWKLSTQKIMKCVFGKKCP